MGLTRGEKDQTGGVHQSGTASSPRLNIPKPHLPKLEVPHLKSKEKPQEKSDKEDSPKRHRHIRRPRGNDHGSHKQLLSMRNPFSKKKPTEAAPAPAGDIGSPQPIPQPTPQPIVSEPKKPIEPSPQPERQAAPPPPTVAESKSLLAVEYVENGRQKSEGGDALPAPVGYRHSFGESICGSKGPVHDFPDGPSPMPSRGANPTSDCAPDLGQSAEGGMSIHRYDKESGKVMEQVSLPDVCAEAAQAERQQQILNLLSGKTWQEKLQWGLDTKNTGNSLYQQRRINDAITAYQDCLLALDFGTTVQEQETVQVQLQIPVVLNLAACMLTTKAYERCKALCNVALQLDPNSLKALFRRGMSYYHLGELDAAKADFRQCHILCYGVPPRTAAEEDPEEALKLLATKSTSFRSANSMKDSAAGIPLSPEDLEKFMKKLNYYLHSIAIQEERYTKACQNMFKQPSTGGEPTLQKEESLLPPVEPPLERGVSSTAFQMSPLAIFKCSRCNFCARRAEKNS